MKEMDTLLDSRPDLVPSFIDLDIRNAQAHHELAAYNNNKRFVGKHPLTLDYMHRTAYRCKVNDLKQNNPDQLIKQVANLQQNIRRIESNIRCKRYRSQDELQGWQYNLKRSKERLDIISKALK